MANAKLKVPEGADAIYLGQALLGYRTRGRKVGGTERIGRRWMLAEQRTAEVETFVKHKFGGVVDTDDAEFLIMPMAATIAWKIVADNARRGDKVEMPALARMVADYLKRWFPATPVGTIGAAAAEVADNRPNLKADEIAVALGVTFADRQRLGFRTIGACDMPSRARKKRVRELNIEKRKSELEGERRAAGALTREEYIKGSKAELARLLGVSRKTIYIWLKDGTLADRLSRADLPEGNRLFLGRDITSSIREQPVTLTVSSAARRDIAGPSRPESDVMQAHDEAVDEAPAPDGPATLSIPARISDPARYRKVVTPVIAALQAVIRHPPRPLRLHVNMKYGRVLITSPLEPRATGLKILPFRKTRGSCA